MLSRVTQSKSTCTATMTSISDNSCTHLTSGIIYIHISYSKQAHTIYSMLICLKDMLRCFHVSNMINKTTVKSTCNFFCENKFM